MKQKPAPTLHIDSTSENTSLFLKRFNAVAAGDILKDDIFCRKL